ncbi:MAG TPA: hypothetical protein VFS20_30220, partial [Longimicrobium sp.]|nr:hypothetical protein [Longimicrobium sp.]
MPEYLAPGVYVEETSFRAKSIEGVSTSTSAFAGPTRRGPIGDTPELVTSFADFSRVYGGLEDLFGQPNYLAHAVRAYFNEGGRRLYVSRAYQATDPDDEMSGVAVGDANVVGAANAIDNARARWVARFPGSAGNGSITVRLDAMPVTKQAMDQAPAGSLLRTGVEDPAQPARITGGAPPFRVKDGSQLLLTLPGNNNVGVTFAGRPASITGTEVLDAEDIAIPEDDRVLEVTVGGGTTQRIELKGTYDTREELIAELDAALEGADVSTPAAGADAGKLVITTDRRGIGATLTVGANATLGFEEETVTQAKGANNTVPDLGNVTVGQINDLLAENNIAVQATLRNGRLVLSTVATGEDATLAVRGGATSAYAELGLTAGGTPAEGSDGPTPAYWQKVGGGGWENEDGDALEVQNDPTWEPQGGAELMLMSVFANDADGNQVAYEGLGMAPGHPRYVGTVLSPTPSSRADQLERMFALEVGSQVAAWDLFRGLFGTGDRATFNLAGGSDGTPPGIQAYTDALNCLQPLEDISIVAAPGHTAFPGWEAIQGQLITYVSRPRAYQIAVLDTPPRRSTGEARKDRGRIDTTRAALYF